MKPKDLGQILRFSRPEPSTTRPPLHVETKDFVGNSTFVLLPFVVLLLMMGDMTRSARLENMQQEMRERRSARTCQAPPNPNSVAELLYEKLKAETSKEYQELLIKLWEIRELRAKLAKEETTWHNEQHMQECRIKKAKYKILSGLPYEHVERQGNMYPCAVCRAKAWVRGVLVYKAALFKDGVSVASAGNYLELPVCSGSCWVVANQLLEKLKTKRRKQCQKLKQAKQSLRVLKTLLHPQPTPTVHPLPNSVSETPNNSAS